MYIETHTHSIKYLDIFIVESNWWIAAGVFHTENVQVAGSIYCLLMNWKCIETERMVTRMDDNWEMRKKVQSKIESWLKVSLYEMVLLLLINIQLDTRFNELQILHSTIQSMFKHRPPGAISTTLSKPKKIEKKSQSL